MITRAPSAVARAGAFTTAGRQPKRPGWDAARPVAALLLLSGLVLGLAFAAPSAVLAAPPAATPAGTETTTCLTRAAHRFAIPAARIAAIIRVESRGDRRAVSPKGAMGLMQLMPATWRVLRARYELGDDPFDTCDNILAGTAYLREMLGRYGLPGALSAYNAGPGRYEDYRDHDRLLPQETRAYVATLLPAFSDPGDAPVVLAALDVLSPMATALFVAPGDGAAAASGRRSGDTVSSVPAARSVQDLSGLVPQSAGLFVALSPSGRAP